MTRGSLDTDVVDVFVGANGPTGPFTVSLTGPLAGQERPLQRVSGRRRHRTIGSGLIRVDFGDGTTGSGRR